VLTHNTPLMLTPSVLLLLLLLLFAEASHNWQ
jgi:hypothetical protein